MQKTTRNLAISIIALGLSGCITRDYRGGIPIRPLQMEQIKSAKTKADIQEILGSPSATNIVGTEKWFYYNSEGTKFAFFDPQFTKYNILTISFDSANNIKEIHLTDLSKKRFNYNSDVETNLPSDIKLNFFQELFGNIGKFNNSNM